MDDLVKDANSSPGDAAAKINLIRGKLPGVLGQGKRFAEAVGTDGTHVFYGRMGEAIVVRPDGTVFRGTLPGNIRLGLTANPKHPFTITDILP